MKAGRQFRSLTAPKKHPLYWKIKAHAHARGEAHARAQQAAQLAKAAGAHANAATAELDKLMKEAGLDADLEYRFDDATETITLAKAPTQIAKEPVDPPKG